jgi:hypothetical protein
LTERTDLCASYLRAEVALVSPELCYASDARAGDAHTQQLLQLQQLADDKEKIYKPIETEGDGQDLPEGRVFSIVKDLEAKFLNRSIGSFAANKKYHEEPTP